MRVCVPRVRGGGGARVKVERAREATGARGTRGKGEGNLNLTGLILLPPPVCWPTAIPSSEMPIMPSTQPDGADDSASRTKVPVPMWPVCVCVCVCVCVRVRVWSRRGWRAVERTHAARKRTSAYLLSIIVLLR